MMIDVSNLTKRFASAKAIDNVSFSVQRGEIVGFLGPNGAGKTTMMRILTGYLPATEGAVLIDGLDVFTCSLEVRRRIGYLPENVALYPEMRVNEFLMFRAELKGVRRAERRDRVEEIKTLCGLKEVERRIIGQLSRGYWQRVGLADTLVHDPKLLILDEPTIGLDPNQIRNVRELIRNLGRRYTVLLSTHFLSEAEMVCRRVMILNQGRIVAADSPEQLMGLLRGSVRVVAEIFGPWHEVVRQLERLPHIQRVLYQPCGGRGAPAAAAEAWGCYVIECEKNRDVRASVSDVVGRRRWALRELRMEKRHLEDVFVEMTIEGNEP